MLPETLERLPAAIFSQLQAIPLHALVPAATNPRKINDQANIDELAASIHAHGLLQSLVVRPLKAEADDDTFEVIAGHRRLEAMRLLAQRGLLASDFKVPCTCIENEDDAEEISLAENVQRESMHPADELVAFKDLIMKGAKPEDIAARFGTTATFVRQRLKLANVAPPIFEAFRAGDIELETVMAYAVSNDDAKQMALFNRFKGDYEKNNTQAIRRALTVGETASSNKLARFVGRAIYEEAGGEIREDMFAEEEGFYFKNTALLENLAAGLLEEKAAELTKAGWAWVKTFVSLTWEESRKYQHYAEGFLSPANQALRDTLVTKLETAQREYEELDDNAANAYELARALDEKIDQLEAELEAFDKQHTEYDAETMANSGCLVQIASDGTLDIQYAMYAPSANDKDGANRVSGHPTGSGKTPPAVKPVKEIGPSAKLVEDLAEERATGLIATIAVKPDIGLALATHLMTVDLFYHHEKDRNAAANNLSNHPASRLPSLVSKSIGEGQIITLHKKLADKLPDKAKAYMGWLLDQDKDVLQELLAYGAARQLNATHAKFASADRLAAITQLAQAAELDMLAYYTPSKDTYFSRLDKATLLADYESITGEKPSPEVLALGKGDLIDRVAALAKRKSWLPAYMRTPPKTVPKPAGKATPKASKPAGKPKAKAKAKNPAKTKPKPTVKNAGKIRAA